MSEPKAAGGAGPYRRTKVFISYRRSGNAGDAERLYDELRGYFSARQLFLDVKSIRRGDLWPSAVETALNSSPALLAVIGPQWLGSSDEQGRRRLDDPSDTLRREVSSALARGAWVIPVLLHGASMPAAEELPDELQRLAECQAVEIRSGHWGTDVKELVALLKRRFYRRRRLAVISSLAAALVVVAALAYRLATVELPVTLGDGNPLAAVSVEYRPSVEEGAEPPSRAEEAPQEIVVEGLSAVGADLLRYDGKPVADLSVDCYAGRFDEETIAEQSLDPKWGEGSARVVFSGADERLHSGEDEEPPPQVIEPVCSTSVAVRAAGGGAPSTLRLFQASESPPEGFREISLRADRPLSVQMEVTKLSDKEGYGLGCSKQFDYGDDDPSLNKPDGDGGIVANADAQLDFSLKPIVAEKAPAGIRFLRFEKATDHVEAFDLGVTHLSAKSVKRRARDVEEIPCGDKEGRANVFFEAISADDERPLRLQRLEVAANHFILAVKGEAHVRSGCEAVSPAFAERVRRYAGRALLLLAAAAGILIGLVYSVVRL